MSLKIGGYRTLDRVFFPCSQWFGKAAVRSMAISPSSPHGQNSYLSHEERTASTPREQSSHIVKLTDITQLSPFIRILRLSPVDETQVIRFRPGQWLDTFIPGLPKAGGFTITSTPSEADSSVAQKCGKKPSLELAVQKSPNNPPATWLWRPKPEILGTELTVRVGGTFVWPPSESVVKATPRNVVMVAGGVGINPLMSMVRHIYSSDERSQVPKHLSFIYATKAAAQPDGSDILFLRQFKDMSKDFESKTGCAFDVQLFITPTTSDHKVPASTLEESAVGLPVQHRRMTSEDLVSLLPEQYRAETVVYICGPKGFTDHFVGVAKKLKGMNEESVMCEKWW